MEVLNKVFDVMHLIYDERVEILTYQLKNVAKTLFDQWKERRDADAPHSSWDCFEKAFLGRFFPHNSKNKGCGSLLL